MRGIREFKIPNKIQSEDYSTDGGLGDIAYNGSVWQNSNGNRNCPYLNRNGSKRNLNLNWIENDWNDNCRFAAVRKFIYFPVLTSGVFFCELSQPSAEHPADPVQFFGKKNIFFIVQGFYFPGDLNKEF